jgi:hypothetical protein
MSELVPACPPTVSRSITTTRSPSDAAWTAGREAGRAGADDGQIERAVTGALVQIGHPQGVGDVPVGRIGQGTAVQEQHQRQAGSRHADAVDQSPPLGRIVGVGPVGDAASIEQLADLVRAR